MEALPDLMSYEEALDFLREKEAIGSPLTTAEWAQVPAEVRRRAFFSATLTSARVAEKMQGYIDEFLDQHKEDFGTDAEHFSAQGRSEFVIKMRELLEKEGFGKVLPDGTIDPEINDNDLRDLRSARRLQLIFDTHVEQACSYGQWLEGQDPDVLDIFPAQRFIRVRPVLAPRAYHEEALDTVRRKDDSKFWIGLNRDFGLPYGPWGFNSGCGVEDVDRDEAEELGVIKPDETPKPQTQHFNEKHQQSTAGLSDDVKLWAEKQLEGVATFKGDKAVMLPIENAANLPEQKTLAGLSDWFKRRKKKPEDEPKKDIEKEETKEQKSDFVKEFIAKKLSELPPEATKAERRQTAIYAEIEAINEEGREEYQSLKNKWIKAREKHKDSVIPHKDEVESKAKLEKFMEDMNKRLSPIWDRLFKENEKFFIEQGLLIPKDERGACNVKWAEMIGGFPNLIDIMTPPSNMEKALKCVYSIVPKKLLPKNIGYNVTELLSRPYSCLGTISCHWLTRAVDMVHEIAHIIEKHNPNFLEICASFVYDRGMGEDLMLLYDGDEKDLIAGNEWTLRDHWLDAYAGKIHINPKKYRPNMSKEDFVKEVSGVEVFACGLARLLTSPAEFERQDPGYYDFTISLLRK